MKIVIIGDGKVGHKLTIQLSEENYDVVLIDQNEGKLKEALNQLDILCITGDGADAKVQKEAGVPGADLVVACASTDELNMLSCLLAKRLGAKHTIARVRNPIYYQQIDLLKEDLRLSMAVNPELAAAFEISRSILLPDTAKEKPQEGKVIAAGPGARDEKGNRIPMEVKVGDVVSTLCGAQEVTKTIQSVQPIVRVRTTQGELLCTETEWLLSVEGSVPAGELMQDDVLIHKNGGATVIAVDFDVDTVPVYEIVVPWFYANGFVVDGFDPEEV